MLVHVIDVDSGNLQSLENALYKLGHTIKLVTSIDDAKELETAERVLLPGVGNFGHFMDQVNARKLDEPIKRYVQSGRPIMGICVGLQAMFEGSEESPTSKGLGHFPGTISKFNAKTKSVPHIGWNGVRLSTDTALYAIDPARKYYFVHSYARIMSEDEIKKQMPGCDYALCTYGEETFLAALTDGNSLFTQFHPEKCGQAGIELIDAFLNNRLKGPKIDNSLSSGLSKRVIACLDVRENDKGDIVVTKGDQYDVREKTDESDVRNLGKPVEVAEKYYKQGADEVTFLNITSYRNSPLRDLPMVQILKLASKSVFVPFTIGGGIRDTYDPEAQKIVPALEVAHLYFRSGADKVSIGGDAVEAALEYYKSGLASGKSPIETISRAYGAQAVVVSVDPKRVYVKDPKDVKHHTLKTSIPGPSGEEYVWYQCTVKGGRETRDLGAYELAQAVEKLGAGELLLNCIDKDGSNSGYDLELVADIKSAVSIPVIASSGAGKPADFAEVFSRTNVDAALGAGMFHRNEYTVEEVKEYLEKDGLLVRL